MVDWALFSRTRTELGASFVRILGYFQEDGEKAVARIEDGMHRRDATALILPAHTLKTEARQFGAEPIGALAEKIEFAGRRAVENRLFPDEILPAVVQLRRLFDETMALFAAEMNPLAQRRPAFGRAGTNQEFGRI
ncbi:Hpt domain-containing protein [Allosphingosinicella flava]|uniref:Hpt domain-containing protein n=1 Tax=Allosphingosinicella flava TaxID=2771430 RepID=A0A7T2GLW1_9SPHN|nr:Hpt domain-containing protein [Sphingosinicella flava]